MEQAVAARDAAARLDEYAGTKVPGLQYVVVNATGTVFERASGWAGVQPPRAMTFETTMMAYSMTKPFTAIAILQLVEQGRIGLDDELDRYLPGTPYSGQAITICQLLDHTSGCPNPIPLRWAHLVEEAGSFDEDAALAQVLRANPTLDFKPGAKFAYSNIGYWLLGKIIEQVTGQPYTQTVQAQILAPLGLVASTMGFAIADPACHANGYLAKYSVMNLMKGFITDSKFWGGSEGKWVRVKSHQLNGPAFGGLVGTARGFAGFLQDQLRPDSLLFNRTTKALLETQQTDSSGAPIPMTLGWHIGQVGDRNYLFKEGGGGGFHSEMRLYPALGIGTVVMVNGTEFNSTRFLTQVDSAFWETAHPTGDRAQ